MANESIYQDIATRTNGDIYIGVVGPVRTGKSTFIKRFMETQVIPNIENIYQRERAKDELPQSGSGRTIMTAEPKFVPEEAVAITLPDGTAFSVRLIDCVGYMIEGAAGQVEENAPRMVTTPWFDYEIPMTDAAELGTKKVIGEHSTIGIVVTTDGTVGEFQREEYLSAEERVITELQELGKPFIVLLNTDDPQGKRAMSIAEEINRKYGARCLPVNCLLLQNEDVQEILRTVLYEFPVQRMDLFLPPWIDALPDDHEIKASIFEAIRSETKELEHIRSAENAVNSISLCEAISRSQIEAIDPGTGTIRVSLEIPRALFYQTLSQRSGFSVKDDGDLMSLLTQLSQIKKEHDKVSHALQDVRDSGYGIVVPEIEELILEEPEIIKQGGRYGVCLKASAPSIHMIRADIQTSVAPLVGSEKQSEEMVDYLLREFEDDPRKIWETNMFGRSFNELVNEDLQSKLKHMPEDARKKLQETLQRIINEGSSGLICIIL